MDSGTGNENAILFNIIKLNLIGIGQNYNSQLNNGSGENVYVDTCL